jgi:hypothetical protein
VTLADALVELGVAATATPEEIRRAYLRLLKTRKPETDPDGFRRLREAYEAASSPGRVGVLAAIREARTDAASGGQASRASEPETAREAQDAEQAPAPPPAPPEREDHFAALFEVQRLVATGSIGTAAERLAEIYDKAAAQRGVVTPDPRVPMELILRLQESQRFTTAKALDGSFRRWLKATDSEVKILGGPLAVRWALVREVCSLPDRVSEKVRTTMARTARDGQLAVALSQLAHFREQSPETARLDAGMLRQGGGPLAMQLAEPLAPSPRPVSARGGAFRAPWALISISMFILSAAGSQLSGSHSTPPSVDTATMFEARLSRVRAEANALRWQAADAGDTHLAEGARRLGDAVDQENCGEAARRAAEMVLQPGDPPSLETQRRAINDDLAGACSIAPSSR